MSTEGAATVAMAVPAAGTGVAIGGIVLVAGAAIVGAGILVARGVVWCGEKIEEHYQQTCRQWTELTEAMRAESRADVQEMSPYLVTQLQYLSANAYLQDEVAQPRSSANQQELAEMLAHTRAAFDDARQVAAQKNDSEKQLLMARLRSEIKTGRGHLSADLIADAERALHGSPAEMRVMLKRLDSAWLSVTEVQAQRSRQVRQTRQLLASASAQFNALDALLRDIRTPSAQHLAQKRDIEEKVLKAQDLLEAQPDHAFQLATTASQELEALLEAISTAALISWEQMRKEVNVQLGILEALSLIVKEAQAIQLVNRQKLDNLAGRVSSLQQEAQGLLQGTSSDTQQRLARLTLRIQLLKEDVFAEVKKSQQQKVADTIQNTLVELGFGSEAAGQPVVKVNGNMLRVEALAARKQADGTRDDKVISFDISSDCQVAYDFGGYVGDACIKDARNVFTALREKGIFILDDHAQEQLRQVPAESVTLETLQQDRFQPFVIRNKTQAELAESIMNVLEKMGYQNFHEQSVGGFIELEAFEGQLGYRVVLSPEGEVQVFKDTSHTEITHDTQDKFIAEVHTLQQEAEQEIEKKSRSPYIKSRNQQMLGH